MSTPNFPTSLDALGQSNMPTAATLAGHNLGTSDAHSDLHDTLAQAVIALETLAGITGSLSAATLTGQMASGWVQPSVTTWTFGSSLVAPSATSCSSATITQTTADLSAIIFVGDRVRLTHNGTTKWFIVTGSAFAGGTHTLTLLGPNQATGSQTALSASGTITALIYSHAKAPAGFPSVSSLDWLTYMTSTSSRTQTNPSANVWANAESLLVPAGSWKVAAQFALQAFSNGSTTSAAAKGGLSGTTATAPAAGFDAYVSSQASAVNTAIVAPCYVLNWSGVLAAAATYYLNFGPGATSGQAIPGIRGDLQTTLIVAECGLL